MSNEPQVGELIAFYAMIGRMIFDGGAPMKLKTVESPPSEIAELTVSPGESGSRAAG